jgi:hypothetical protein
MRRSRDQSDMPRFYTMQLNACKRVGRPIMYADPTGQSSVGDLTTRPNRLALRTSQSPYINSLHCTYTDHAHADLIWVTGYLYFDTEQA